MSGLGLTEANDQTQVEITDTGADTYITFDSQTSQLSSVTADQISFADDFIFS